MAVTVDGIFNQAPEALNHFRQTCVNQQMGDLNSAVESANIGGGVTKQLSAGLHCVANVMASNFSDNGTALHLYGDSDERLQTINKAIQKGVTNIEGQDLAITGGLATDVGYTGMAEYLKEKYDTVAEATLIPNNWKKSMLGLKELVEASNGCYTQKSSGPEILQTCSAVGRQLAIHRCVSTEVCQFEDGKMPPKMIPPNGAQSDQVGALMM